MSYEVYYFGYDGRSLPSIDSDVSEAYVRHLMHSSIRKPIELCIRFERHTRTIRS